MSTPGIIVLNGPFRMTSVLRLRLSSAPVLAADGGLARLRRQDVTPDAVLGDFDSSPVPRQIPRRRYPVRKDATDGELALDEALSRGWDPVLVVGAFGGRYDMALSHLALLRRARRYGVQASLTDGLDEALLAGHEPVRLTPPGGRVSILPLTPEARLDSVGLEWPLSGLALRWDEARGVSNRIREADASVWIVQGQALVVRPLA